MATVTVRIGSFSDQLRIFLFFRKIYRIVTDFLKCIVSRSYPVIVIKNDYIGYFFEFNKQKKKLACLLMLILKVSYFLESYEI